MTLPVMQGGLPTFVRSLDPNELWPIILEKGFAKWAGSWEEMAGGLQNSHTPIGTMRAQLGLKNSNCCNDSFYLKGDNPVLPGTTAYHIPPLHTPSAARHYWGPL